MLRPQPLQIVLFPCVVRHHVDDDRPCAHGQMYDCLAVGEVPPCGSATLSRDVLGDIMSRHLIENEPQHRTRQLPASTTAQSLAASPSKGSVAGSSARAPGIGVQCSFIWRTATGNCSAHCNFDLSSLTWSMPADHTRTLLCTARAIARTWPLLFPAARGHIPQQQSVIASTIGS